MARIKPDITLTVKHTDKKSFKLELVRIPSTKRYWLYRDGKASVAHETISWTDACHLLREWGK